MKLIKTCRNCKHCIPAIITGSQYDKCKRNRRAAAGNGFAYCSLVKDYHPLYSSCTPRDLIHWEPKPPIKDKIMEFRTNLLDQINNLDNLLDEYWKKFINLIK
ncbi:hypothetical protein b3_0096 [Synechococcus phage B3]|nr:hypothetical protein b3_0096 [Synechococcus phage B3]QGT54710.1 hypothetical protein b23_0095 [Synechococcus phage B23]